jgi:hypothetical protein
MDNPINKEIVEKIAKYIKTLYKIEFSDDTVGKIVIIPERIIYITDNKLLVVMINYTFTFQDEIIKSSIPYYISDAYTNYLRANLLFPFICINRDKDDTTYPNCMYSTAYGDDNKALIIKLNIFTNLNLLEYQANYIDNLPINLEYCSFITRIYKNKHRLPSVLRRVTNICNFIIAFHNLNILNYNIDNIEYYKPMDIEKNKTTPLEWLEVFNMNDNSNRKEMSQIKENDYRNKLLEHINILLKHINNLKLYTIEELIIRPNDDIDVMTKSEFNKYIATCTSKNSFNFNNILNYYNISRKIDLIIKNKLTNIKIQLAKKKTTNESYNIIKKIYVDKPKEDIDLYDIKDKITRSWKTVCYKYLKYKNKYLQLKKLTNN